MTLNLPKVTVHWNSDKKFLHVEMWPPRNDRRHRMEQRGRLRNPHLGTDIVRNALRLLQALDERNILR